MLGLIDNLGFGEFLIVGVAALLIFGRRLPEVAAQAGAQMSKLRRSLDTLRRESGIDREIQNMRGEMTNVVPRDLSIGDMARAATREIQATLREVERVEPTAPSSASVAPPRPPPSSTAEPVVTRAPSEPTGSPASGAPPVHGEPPRDAAGGSA